MNDLNTILTHILEIAQYNKDRDEYRRNFMESVRIIAMVNTLAKVPDEEIQQWLEKHQKKLNPFKTNSRNFLTELASKKTDTLTTQAYTDLSALLNKYDFNAVLQEIITQAFTDLFSSLSETLPDEKREELASYINSLN